MDIPDFNKELAPYIVAYPYVSNQIGQQPDGNPILYDAFMMAAKKQFFPLSEEDKQRLNDLYADVFIEPGMFERSRFKTDDTEEHDDRIGMVWLGYYLNKKISTDIHDYGKKHFWIWDENKIGFPKNLRHWDYRFGAAVPHYKMAVADQEKKEVTLNWFDKFFWYLAIGVFGFKDESGIQKEWLMVDLYRNQHQKNSLMDKASQKWERKLAENPKYPNRMGSVFAKYFGEHHLLARWMAGRIFKTTNQ